MRFRRIHIPAYGKFTDFTLTFPRGQSDFHLIYGANEAGKSTLLRAMQDFLFGIPLRSSANFLHSYGDLRIEAELEDSAGHVYTFRRRKGNKDTLLDASDAPVPDSQLSKLLGIVDESYFTSMFGMGSQELRDGADALLRGEGDLGKALFSARLGGTPVDQVIAALQSEAETLLAGRSKGRIREAINRYTEHQKAKKAALINPDDWTRTERDLAEETHKQNQIKAQIQENQARRNWLERCRQSRSLVRDWEDCSRQLAELDDLPDLPVGFTAEARDAEKRLITIDREIQRITSALALLQSESDSIVQHPDVLAMEPQIDSLHTRISSYQSDLQEIKTLESLTAQQRRKLLDQCRDLDLAVDFDDLESVRLTEAQASEAAHLADALDTAQTVVDGLKQQIDTTERELARLDQDSNTADLARLDRLTTLIDRAADIRSIAAGLQDEEAEVATLERRVKQSLLTLSRPDEDPEITNQLSVPDKAHIQEFQRDFDDRKIQYSTAQAEIQRLRREIEETDATIKRLDRQGEIPTLESLTASRQHRDGLWDAVRDAWDQHRPIGEATASGEPLVIAFSDAIIKADDIADRLRIDATRVAQKEELLSKRDSLHQRLEKETRCLAEIAEHTHTLDQSWKAAWAACAIDPRSPDSMLDWRAYWEDFQRIWDQLLQRRDIVARHRRIIHDMAQELQSELGAQEQDFLRLLAQAQQLRKLLDDARTRENTRLERQRERSFELESLRRNLPPASSTLAGAKAAWNTCREDCSLPTGLSLDTSLALLKKREALFALYDARQDSLSRLDALRENQIRYQEEVIGLAQTLLGTRQREVILSENALFTALNEAKQAAMRQEDIAQRIRENESQLADKKQSKLYESAAIHQLYRRAGLSDSDICDPGIVERRLLDLDRRRKLIDVDQSLRTHLSGMTDGIPIPEFIEHFRAEDLALLEENITKLDEKGEALTAHYEEIQSRKLALESRKREYEQAQDQAAREEQNADFALSSLRNDTERYLRLQVAISMLQSQIDTFRKRNQGPFMEKASYWFSEITGGSFTGIKPSYRDGDRPVIVGTRTDDPTQKEVDIQGMSEGTRDQLYLALRLSGLEMHREGYSPVPMILDDLLVHFDDQRSVYALKALSQLARGSQVLLFTHHHHIADLATDALGTEQFHRIEI